MRMTIEEIKARLEQLGYETAEGDNAALRFALKRTEERINNLCNTNEVPDELYYKGIDMACGEFLGGRMMLGGLDSYDETDGRLIKTIAEGDTSVTYLERKSCAQRLESFIDTLCLTDSEIIRFRKFKW